MFRQFLLSLAFLLPLAAGDAAPPTLTLAGNGVSLTLAVPDATTGYYRSTRFVWGGMVIQAEWKGHTVFGVLKKHNPTRHDGGSGSAEEFGLRTAIGWQDIPVGGEFLKIGVGGLKKTEDKQYAFNGAYPIVTPGTWEVSSSATEATFVHTLKLGDGAWAYRYEKTVALLPAEGGPGFAVHHKLTNQGAKAIATEHYDHRMVIIDKQPIGAGYALRFRAPPAVKHPRDGATIADALITLTAPLGGAWWTPLSFPDGTPTWCSVEHAGAGIALDMEVDRPASTWELYAEATAMCPEAFIAVDVQPGATMAWTSSFRFRSLAP